MKVRNDILEKVNGMCFIDHHFRGQVLRKGFLTPKAVANPLGGEGGSRLFLLLPGGMFIENQYAMIYSTLMGSYFVLLVFSINIWNPSDSLICKKEAVLSMAGFVFSRFNLVYPSAWSGIICTLSRCVSIHSDLMHPHTRSCVHMSSSVIHDKPSFSKPVLVLKESIIEEKYKPLTFNFEL